MLAIAAARPRMLLIHEQKYLGRDLILTLDVSGSMKEYDFKAPGSRTLTRLDAVKLVVSEFVKERIGDRIGLVIFGSHSYVQAPLTSDHGLLVQLINLLRVGVAGDGTAIGDGLGTSLNRLKDIEGSSKAIILLTDGANNSGQVNPLQAAKIAKQLDIKIHTIGIGSGRSRRQGSLSSIRGAQAEFDEPMLKEIASLTGGVYFNAKDLEGLKRVYDEIDSLENRATDEPQRQDFQELFAPYAFAAGCFLVLYLLLSETIYRKIP